MSPFFYSNRFISRKLQICLLAEVKNFEYTFIVYDKFFTRDKSKYAVLCISPVAIKEQYVPMFFVGENMPWMAYFRKPFKIYCSL